MPRSSSPGSGASPVKFISGEDDFAVKQRAKQIYQEWCQGIGGMDHEIVDAAVTSSGEALKAISKLRMALQTLPFFGGGKVVWLQNCSFLGDDRTASSEAVTGALADLSGELKAFEFTDVKLLISAGKVDRRKTFYKTVEKLGEVEIYDGLSSDDKDWQIKAEAIVEQLAAEAKKKFAGDAVSELVAFVGPNSRMLASEMEKLILYLGTREQIKVEDVEAVVTRNKTSRAFAMSDALGERNLPKLLKYLDEELWSLKVDSKRSEIGLLYGAISKIRNLLLVKELMREGLLRPSSSTAAIQAQVMKIPQERLPQDKTYNPASVHPFVLMKAMNQAENYSTAELIRAMDLLLRCNHGLVSSDCDEALLLQKTLIEIVSRPANVRTQTSTGSRQAA